MCKAWLGPFAGKLAFVSETSESRGRACFGSGDTIDLDEVEWNLTERVWISQRPFCVTTSESISIKTTTSFLQERRSALRFFDDARTRTALARPEGEWGHAFPVVYDRHLGQHSFSLSFALIMQRKRRLDQIYVSSVSSGKAILYAILGINGADRLRIQNIEIQVKRLRVWLSTGLMKSFKKHDDVKKVLLWGNRTPRPLLKRPRETLRRRDSKEEDEIKSIRTITVIEEHFLYAVVTGLLLTFNWLMQKSRFLRSSSPQAVFKRWRSFCVKPSFCLSL